MRNSYWLSLFQLSWPPLSSLGLFIIQNLSMSFTSLLLVKIWMWIKQELTGGLRWSSLSSCCCTCSCRSWERCTLKVLEMSQLSLWIYIYKSHDKQYVLTSGRCCTAGARGNRCSKVISLTSFWHALLECIWVRTMQWAELRWAVHFHITNCWIVPF